MRDQLLFDSGGFRDSLCFRWCDSHSPLLSASLFGFVITVVCPWSPWPLQPQHCLMTFQLLLSQFFWIISSITFILISDISPLIFSCHDISRFCRQLILQTAGARRGQQSPVLWGLVRAVASGSLGKRFGQRGKPGMHISPMSSIPERPPWPATTSNMSLRYQCYCLLKFPNRAFY